MKNTYIQNHFMGKKIKCSPSLPSKSNILEALYVMTYESSKRLRLPLGFHVRVRFTKKMNMQKFSARLTTHYQRKWGYKPLRVSVKEDDPSDNGVHYHIAIILDGKVNTKKSLQYFLALLQQSGLLNDYKVIPPTSNSNGLKLHNEILMDQYFEWMSYLAKESTKVQSEQAVSYCKAVQADMKNWRRDGRPSLSPVRRIPKLCAKSAPETPLEAFISDPVGMDYQAA